MKVLRMRARAARRLWSRQGFTMVELMVVVVVIAILATAVGFASTKLIGSSIEANMKSDAKSVHTALVEHFVDYNRFPSSIMASTGASSATTMLFEPSEGNVMAIAAGGTTTQVTVNVTNPKKPGFTCSITARPSGTAKPLCS